MSTNKKGTDTVYMVHTPMRRTSIEADEQKHTKHEILSQPASPESMAY